VPLPSLAEDLRAEEKAELAANGRGYPGKAMQFLLGSPIGGVISFGAAAKLAARTPVLSWALYKVQGASTTRQVCALDDGLMARGWQAFIRGALTRHRPPVICEARLASRS
jgi:hypothetical protein